MARLEINKAPSDSDTHTWADYLEMLAVVSMDGTCTVGMAVDRIRDVASEADLDDDVVSGDPNEVERSENKRKIARAAKKFADAWQMLLWRKAAYEDAYPFELDDSSKTIRLVDVPGTGQYFYLFLLAAANLRFVAAGAQALQNGFEAIACEVMKEILPRRAEVHIFGKATADDRFSGSAFEKVSKLAREIRAQLIATEEDYRTGDIGDSGIDIVAWDVLADEECNIPVYLGQCACSRSDWPKKQHEASPGRLASSLRANPDWQTLMFVPICFRRVGGRWAVKTEIGAVIMLDRLRLLKNKTDYTAAPIEADVRRVVDAVMAAREGVV